MPRAVASPDPRRLSDEARRRYREGAPRIPDQGLDLVELFPETPDIELEIGFGRGGFLLGRAEAVPTAALIGVEAKAKWAWLVAERARELGLGKVRPFAGDARRVLKAIGPDASLARVFLHFPDPWWKKRHAKRRLFDGALVDEVARLLRPGGELFVQTDVQERFEEYAAVLRDDGRFDVRIVDANPYAAQSNRERRAIEDGNPIFRLLAAKLA